MKATADDQTNEPAESITASAIEGWGMSCSNNYLTSSTNFDFWNANPTHMANNNCYNYAANWRNNTFAVPGRQSGQYFSSVSCSDVSNSVRGDGWSDSCVSSNNLSIYLVIWPGYDFHFYRLCYNGRWCHKPGDDPATNKDNNGNFITNPETCAKSPYSNCSYGYFYASNGIVVS